MRIKHILALILFPFLLACAAPENGPLVPPPAPGPGEDTNPGGDDPDPNPGGDTPGTKPGTPGEYVVIGYATYWESTMPDPTLLTHINYAFGKIGSDFETLKINTDSRLKKLVGLKKTNPSLKVLTYFKSYLGLERAMYGTDYPFVEPFYQTELLDNLGLTENEKEQVNWKNAKKLFCLDI